MFSAMPGVLDMEKTLSSIIRFNCSFSPLTFSKLRFWSPKKKKLQNNLLSFALVAVLAPKADIDSVYADVAP